MAEAFHHHISVNPTKTDHTVVSSRATGLTHLCRMEFHSLINWTSQFPFEGLLDDSFHFSSNCDRTFCKQTVETLIRRRIVRRLVWVSTICTCPTKRTLDLNWLMFECSPASIFCEGELPRFSRTCACMQIRLSLGCTIVICMHDRMPASDIMMASSS